MPSTSTPPANPANAPLSSIARTVTRLTEMPAYAAACGFAPTARRPADEPQQPAQHQQRGAGHIFDPNATCSRRHPADDHLPFDADVEHVGPKRDTHAERHEQQWRCLAYRLGLAIRVPNRPA